MSCAESKGAGHFLHIMYVRVSTCATPSVLLAGWVKLGSMLLWSLEAAELLDDSSIHSGPFTKRNAISIPWIDQQVRSALFLLSPAASFLPPYTGF